MRSILLLLVLFTLSACSDPAHDFHDDGGDTVDATDAVDAPHTADATDTMPDACAPAPGAIFAGCSVILGVLTNGTDHQLSVLGKLTGIGNSPSDVIMLDTIEIRDGCRVVQSIASPRRVTPDIYYYARFGSDAASAEVVSACSAPPPRIDPFTVAIRGTLNGAPFEARCGAGETDTAWPPRVRLGCHHGLSEIPIGSFANETTSGDFVGIEFDANDHFVSADGTFDFRATSYPSRTALAPRSTSGWMLQSITPTMDPTLGNVDSAMFGNASGAIGPAYCPSSGVPPTLVASVHGTAASGAFDSEVYFDACAGH